MRWSRAVIAGTALLGVTAVAAGVSRGAGVDQPQAAFARKHDAVRRPLYVTQAPIIMLKDVDSGAILFSRGADQRFAPASMTKVMTAYVVLDLVKTGKIKFSDRFEMTEEIWKQWQARPGNSTMFLKPGEAVSVDNLLMGLLTVSGNDAATLLGVGIDGSEAEFINRMNRVAHKLGMKSSQFGTPSGWPDGGATKVTAGDMILLAESLIRDHPQAYARYFSAPSFQHGKAPDGTPIVQRNRNPILGRVEGADGLKTGYTVEAGYCFLGSAKRGGRRLIMVVGGMESAKARRDEAERIMAWGFEAWEGRVIAAAGSPMLKMDVDHGTSPDLMATNSLAIRMTVPRGYKGGYQARIRGSAPLPAPVRQGDPVAKFIVTPYGLPPQETPLVAAATVEQGAALHRARTGLYRMTGF